MQISLEKFISKNETIAVAVSGGGDSMALLHYMQNNAKKYLFNVIAINVEHGIRGNDSISDTNFVISYCKDNNIPLLTYSVDCVAFAESHKLSLEQAGRILRYQIFNQAITDKKCDKVATAHHLQDNVESVLFNLFRGTGLKGLAGIDEQFENKIIRPLLDLSKTEIEEYL
jgi:tRNA(Ile)-lysidine synthase